MVRFLLDANLSPKTADLLRRQFSFDVISLIEEDKSGLLDEEVIAYAENQSRIIITLDLDFGKLYHEARLKSPFGIIIVRAHDQRVERVNSLLQNFFASRLGQKIFQESPYALVVIEDTVIRKIL